MKTQVKQADLIKVYRSESGRIQIKPDTGTENNLIEATVKKVHELNTYDEAFNAYFQNKEVLRAQQAELNGTPEDAPDYRVKYRAVLILLVEALELSTRIRNGSLQSSF